MSRFDIGEELKHIKGLRTIHVNMRLNAAYSGAEAVQLGVGHDEGHACAVLRNIDIDGKARDITAGINTPVPIIEGAKTGRLLFVTSLVRQLTAHVYLSYIRVPVEALKPRSVQCGNCCRFGHMHTARTFNVRCP